MTWTPTENGTFEVRGSWNGDAGTEGAESELKTVTVEKAPPAEKPITVWEITVISVVVIVVVAVIATYLLKMRKPKA